jgi:hypothetical protein
LGWCLASGFLGATGGFASALVCEGRYVSCFLNSFPIFSIKEGINSISDFLISG